MTEKQEWKKGFKVVAVSDGSLVSAMNYTAEVKYQVGKVTEPNEGMGPLAVFPDLDDAKGFDDFVPYHTKVFTCEYLPSERNRLSNGSFTTPVDCLQEFGTVATADAVILREEIQ